MDLSEVHRLQSFRSVRAASGAVEQLFDVPQVDEYPARRVGSQRCFEDRFERRQPGWGEVARGFNLLHDPVAAARRDDRAATDAAIEREVDRSQRPFHAFRFAQKRRLQQDERADGDAVTGEEPDGVREIIGRHLLVQLRQYAGMDRLQADGDFEARAERVAKADDALVAELRVVLDDDGFKTADPVDDRRMVGGRNRLRVKEVSAVVKFDVLRRRKPRQGEVDLLRDRPDRHGFVGRVLPQVAHQAAKRALAVGEEDRGNLFNPPAGGALRFDQVRVRPADVERVLRPAGREDGGG